MSDDRKADVDAIQTFADALVEKFGDRAVKVVSEQAVEATGPVRVTWEKILVVLQDQQ